MIQDYMQFVRPFDENVRMEYSNLFSTNSSIIEIDPRFLRRLGEIEINSEIQAYHFCEKDYRSSFADVGILKLSRLTAKKWKFKNTEHENKIKAHELGFEPVSPYTPIFMHVLYPVIYRKGILKSKHAIRSLSETTIWQIKSPIIAPVEGRFPPSLSDNPADNTVE
jgi:hypothetical protein